MSSTICCIDGDLLSFKASAANEHRSIKALHIPSGRSKVFKHRTELKELIGDKFPLSDFAITDVQEADDVSYALHTVKQMIKNICQSCSTDKYEIYLSGPNNFRDKLPLPTKYKGNREGLTKPLQLGEVKDYLIDVHSAKVVDGEADDKLSIRQYEGMQAKEKVIACSTDKDSYGCQGWLYDWDKMTSPFLVKGLGELRVDEKGKVRGYGNKWKYLQWVVGDTIDGLNPSYLAKVKFGEKSGYKLLNDLQTDGECWQAVHDLYLKWYPNQIEYVEQNGLQIEANYLDLAQTYFLGVHMKRWEDDYPNIKETMKKMEII